MKVKDYFKRMQPQDDVTFVKARARKNAPSPGYHAEYQTTPMFTIREITTGSGFDRFDKLLNSIVLNDKQMPIDWLSGAPWGIRVTKGYLKCLLIISQEDFELLYPDKDQRKSMEKFIEERLF